ncbi:MAG: SDR family NAD(P)-dependent oxidoreductase [Myxococcota bacterium]
MSLEGSVAVVTGSAGGIGRACAVRLARDGADVGLLDLKAAELEETKALVEQAGRRCEAVAVDLTDRDATAEAFARLRTTLGFLEILHANAGGAAGGRTRTFPKADAAQWDAYLDLNLRVAADCSRLVLPEMIERKTGRIIHTSSERAFLSAPGMTEYSAAKAGLLGFTKALALDVARHGITVNAVCPGIIRTPLTDAMPKDRIEQSIASVPAGRIGEPEDIAHAVSFLASPGASYVTGEHLLVTGGRTIH